MRLVNKTLLSKYFRKNRGNTKLLKSIKLLISDIEANIWTSEKELKKTRNDADRVHSSGVYIFNLSDHRTMIMIEFSDAEATVIWCGDHDAYEFTFKNNKTTIKKWLLKRGWI